MKKVKKEISTTGGVAGFSGPISAPGNPTKKELRRRKKQVDKLVKVKENGKMKKSVKKTKKVESIDEAADKMIRDMIVKVITEQAPDDDRMTYIIRLFEGISKNLNISLSYTRMFILDALKMDAATGAAKLNAQRATTELNHIRKMINDLESLITQIYRVNMENKVGDK